MPDRPQLKDLVRKHGIKAKYLEIDEMPNGFETEDLRRHSWMVTLHWSGRMLSSCFNTGSEYRNGAWVPRYPTATDVLGCLCSDAASADQTFEQWCSDFGYDTDSRRAERCYHDIQESTRKLRRFLGEQYDTFLQAEW